ncbi:MAG: YcxB family protein [Defluviitaleaceae bacterium]|nr:YcxB family protein [Defluviitaleaceae bacterium]
MFETTSVINKDTLIEIKKHLMPPRAKRIYILLIIGGLLMAVGGIFFIVDPYVSHNGSFMVVVAVGLSVSIVTAICYFIQPNTIVKTNVNRFKESGHTEVRITSSFTEDKIKIQNSTSGATGEVGYDVVYRFAETENFYTLFTKTEQFIMVNKISLIEAGKNEEFVKFIRGKCF